MQIIACLIVLALPSQFQFNEHDIESNVGEVQNVNFSFIVIYLILHLLSYIVHYFRIHDIKINGKPDVYGVYSARRETFLSNFETFLVCIVIGFSVKHLVELEYETFHKEAIHSYFLVVDSVLTFFYKPFIYLGLIVKLEGEIKKNLYTLYFAQDQLIQEEKRTEVKRQKELAMMALNYDLTGQVTDKMTRMMHDKLGDQVSMAFERKVEE